jgi:antimicrobial peptide system SdpA family protein
MSQSEFKADSGEASRRDFVIGVSVLLLAFVWLVVAVYAVHASMPTNPIKLPAENSVRVVMWLPQGWKFFTRSPREERYEALALTPEGGWTRAVSWPNARAANLFGLSRRGRAQSVEVGLLEGAAQSKSDKPLWQSCDAKVEECLAKMSPIEVDNTTPQPAVCGEVALIKRPPIPWAWTKSTRKVEMPAKVLRLKVRC